MSVIQKIRDKYARWAVVAIALSLLGFILMDALAGRGSIFGQQSTTIGKINGRKIDYIEFNKKVQAQEEMARAQGYDMGEAGRQQVIESVWSQEIMQQLLQEQIDELGLTVGKKELNDMLFGSNPPQDLRQNFSDPQTGVYNPQAAQQYINQVKSQGTPEQKAQFNDYLGQLEFGRMTEKYATLLSSTIYFPKWFVEKQNTDNSLVGRASYVSVPYTTISDSAVKVSDADIKAYMNDHKEDFEQKEETRSISYVVFNASPSAADTAAVRQQLETLKPQFQAAPNAGQFVAQQGSAINFADQYFGQTQIQVPNKDSIFALPTGGVFGPYLDANNYVLAKKLDVKTMPDSAKVRHILVSTGNPQTGQQLLPDSVAKRRIDSIATAINNGASFDSMVVRYSDDPGSKEKGGVYDFFPQGQMVPAFNDFAFGKSVGTRDVVKTDFGYHLVEVLGHKGSQPYYKIAYLAKPIAPSNETDQAASSAASLFAGDARDLKAFNESFDKSLKGKGYNKLVAQDIKESDFSIQGLGSNRTLVRNIFEADNGDVLQPERVGDNYVVVAVTEVNEEGMMSVAKARSVVEPVLRNEKKADLIKQKLGKISTLEAASAAAAQPVQVADSLRFNGANAVFGYEGKVIGAVFNPANKGKVVPEAIEGQSGVYVLRVDNIAAAPVMNADVKQQQEMLKQQARQGLMYRNPVQALQEAAEVTDNRSKFY
ncbi:MAG TPA: peptidylprolyl isomerase [Chitinophagaceae bacterium]